MKITPNELMDEGLWDEYCELFGVNYYAVSDGKIDGDAEIVLTPEEAQQIGLVPDLGE